MTEKPTLAEATLKLEYYCSYQERCHQEVVDKLYQLGMKSDEIDAIVVHLLQHNFLNEERFARSFARGKHRIKSWGKIRIVTVRLACVKHAASVQSEPGSNSSV